MNKEVPLKLSTATFVDYFKQTANASHEELLTNLVLLMSKLDLEGFDVRDLVEKSIKNEAELVSFIRGNFARDLREMNDAGVFDTKEAKELYEEIIDSPDAVLIGFVLESVFNIKGDNEDENN